MISLRFEPLGTAVRYDLNCNIVEGKLNRRTG